MKVYLDFYKNLDFGLELDDFGRKMILQVVYCKHTKTYDLFAQSYQTLISV